MDTRAVTGTYVDCLIFRGYVTGYVTGGGTCYRACYRMCYIYSINNDLRCGNMLPGMLPVALAVTFPLGIIYPGMLPGE